MVRKKMEGDESQRRKRARRARRQKSTPSADQVTTGGSKQRRHLKDEDHVERVQSIHRGKQQDWPPDPSPGSR